MKLLITGICGFVGSVLARSWREAGVHDVIGIDNLSRPGSEVNRRALLEAGIDVIHGDIRNLSDLQSLGDVNAVIDAAANPSVLAGVDGKSSSRQVVEHNLGGTLNLLEFCRERRAAFVMLSTSRVYNIPAMLAIPMVHRGDAFAIDPSQKLPAGVSEHGIDETFPAYPPCSVYGATKLASEHMALEFGQAYDFPVWINRCGVMAGAGQFGKPDQGIFSFWINSHLREKPLKYIGFEGTGHQVRDCLHPADLLPAIEQQLAWGDKAIAIEDRVTNFSGGIESATSLKMLSDWCAKTFDMQRDVAADLSPRPFDLPWVVLDNRKAARLWNWRPTRDRIAICSEIADHARAHPHWLELSQDKARRA